MQEHQERSRLHWLEMQFEEDWAYKVGATLEIFTIFIFIAKMHFFLEDISSLPLGFYVTNTVG